MRITVAAAYLLSTTTAFVVSPPLRNAVRSSLSATETDITSIVEKMSRLDAAEKASMKSLLYKAGDVHPDAAVKTNTEDILVAAGSDMATVSESASPVEAVMVSSEGAPVETTPVSDVDAPAEATLSTKETPIEAIPVSEIETPAEITLVSEEADSPVLKEEPSAETTLVSNEPEPVMKEAMDATTAPDAVDVTSLTETSIVVDDSAVQMAKAVVENTECQDTSMLADLVVDVVNSSSELVETVASAISQLS